MQALNLLFGATKLVVEGAKIVNEIDDLASKPSKLEDDNRALDIGITVLKSAVLVVSAASVAAEAGGATSDTLARIKAGEATAQIIYAPAKLTQMAVKYSKDQCSVQELVGEGIVAPAASIGRSVAEHEYHRNKHLQTLPPEQRREPIYTSTSHDDEVIITGYKSVTEEQCTSRMAVAQNAIIALSTVEVGVKIATLMAKPKKEAHPVYQGVLNDMHARSTVRNTATVAAAAPEVAAPEIDPYNVNLLNFDYIPNSLHEDVVLRRYICAITQLPIRHPVGDPNGRTLYERSAIETWLRTNTTSPVTRQPLTVDQLIDRPAVRATINHRLSHHTQQLQIALADGLVAAPVAAIQQQADQENPNL